MRQRVATGLLVGVVLAVAPAVPAGASSAPAHAALAPSVGTAAVETAAVETAVPTMIVLDASGSMLADDAPGRRIDAARNAATALIDALPAGAPIGLQVYGTGTGSGDDEKTAGCQDVVTLAEVGPHDPAELKTAIAGIEARGYTPIGTALQSAAAALPAEGPRSVVLVSDGEDTCAPPTPCDVARELDLAGTDLVVHSVGFKVDQAARDQLACIAEATGGTYTDAVDAPGLTEILTVTVEAALDGYAASGTPVTGAEQQTPDAPLLEAGQYVDTLPVGATDTAPGSVRYYRVPTPAGARVHLSATLVHPEQDDVGYHSMAAEVSLVDLDGRDCVSASGMSTPFTIDPRFTTVTARLTIDGETDCTSRDELFLRVERTADAWAAVEIPVELTVRIEPPTTDPGPPADDNSPDLPKPVATPAVAVTGGRSFNEAALLQPGQTVSDTVREGEVKFYRIPLTWGQRLNYLLREVGPVQGDVFVGNNVEVTVFNPVREEITEARDATMTFNNKGSELLGATPLPIAYLLREKQHSDLSLDGDFYLVVTGSRHNGDDEPPATTTVELTAVVAGDAATGPTYSRLGGVGSPSTGTGGPSSSVDMSVADTTGPTSAFPSTSAPTGTTPEREATLTDDTAEMAVTGTAATRNGGNGTVWWVVGAAGLILVAGAAIVLLRRRHAH